MNSDDTRRRLETIEGQTRADGYFNGTERTTIVWLCARLREALDDLEANSRWHAPPEADKYSGHILVLCYKGHWFYRITTTEDKICGQSFGSAHEAFVAAETRVHSDEFKRLHANLGYWPSSGTAMAMVRLGATV